MAIDHTEFVEASKDQKSLEFGDEKQQANFELGVSMAVHAWDDLKTAVDNQWGGPDSADKRDWISSVVVDLFTSNKAVDVALIEETLLYAMVDEFDTEIDDDSALVVGKQIIDFYKQCQEKNYTSIRAAYESWVAKQSQKQTTNTIVVGADPNNPDVSDDEDDDGHEDDEQSQVPALVETVNEDTEMMDAHQDSNKPIVDDDGFELVQSKGRKGRR